MFPYGPYLPYIHFTNILSPVVNFTETLSALSMITKAGVPSNQIAVGVASYARSFQMVDPSCTGKHGLKH
jgi:hypothetical protein